MNTFFQFKQFRIEQDQCAMKVCTDSCLFGAYINPAFEVKFILDIGTGTGLLALMLAQKSNAEIDAVEIDPGAARQAKENVEASPWKERIRISGQSIQEFSVSASRKYQLIISNPPFFNKNLKSPDSRINAAHHNDLLSPQELIASVAALLAEDGTFAVMLPPHETELLEEEAAKKNLLLQKKCFIQDRKTSEPSRIISIFGFSNTGLTEEQMMIIKENDKTYSSEFRKLLADYYLHL